ncbi:MAG: hypothetical protein ACI30S_01100 [Muribaculaceae bacterium]
MDVSLKKVLIKISELQMGILEMNPDDIGYQSKLENISSAIGFLISAIDCEKKETPKTVNSALTDEELEDVFVQNVNEEKAEEIQSNGATEGESVVTETCSFDEKDADVSDNEDDMQEVTNVGNQSYPSNLQDIFDEDIDDISGEEQTDNESTKEPVEEGFDEITQEEPIVQDNIIFSHDVISDEESESEREQEGKKLTAVEDTKIKVDEVLSRHKSKDIYKAFTLNDKFRFRRELFGNSSAQYNEALDLISEMGSYTEAEDYFLNNYGWNPEDDSTKAFLKIIEHHFNAQ